MDVFELKDWFSIDDAAARLSRIEGKAVSPDTALYYLSDGKLQASILSRQVFAVPLICMNDDEAKSHVGSSWRNPNGRLMAAISLESLVVLTAIKPVLDLPVCRSGVGDFVVDARERNLDVNRAIKIPPGTLVQTPNKDEYFCVLGGSDVPKTYGQIVIRTESLREFERQLEALNPSPPVAVAELVEPAKAGPIANWKMQIQTEATVYCLRLRKSGASPTKHSILEPMAKWCRDNDVKTETKIYPSANYLRTHVLGGKHWDVPN